MIKHKERIIPIFGAGLILISLFLPWETLIAGPNQLKFPYPGYSQVFGLISGVIGLLVLIIAVAPPKPGKFQAIALITLGLVTITMPSLRMTYLLNRGNGDCFLGHPIFCPTLIEGIGINVLHLGALIVIVDGLFIWMTSMRTQNNKPFATTFITAEQGQFTR